MPASSGSGGRSSGGAADGGYGDTGVGDGDAARRETELTVAVGDALVLMSDGFPERFNPQDEMPGYDYVATALADTGHASAETIVSRFVHLGDTWAAGRKQDDDVTFVVIKSRRSP